MLLVIAKFSGVFGRVVLQNMLRLLSRQSINQVDTGVCMYTYTAMMISAKSRNAVSAGYVWGVGCSCRHGC